MRFMNWLQRRRVSITICVITVLLIAIGVTIGKSRPVSGTYQSNETAKVSSNIIDGAVNKDLIPDHMAYTVFLSFVASQSKNNKRAVDSYLKFHGFGDTDIKAIYAVAEVFRQQTVALDAEAKQIKDRDWPKPGVASIARLDQLQQQHEAAVKVSADSFNTDLSKQGQERMNDLIKDHIKSRIKISK